MNRIDGRIVLSPTDLVGLLACEHLTQLDLAVLRGERERPSRQDPMLDLLRRLGADHETAQLKRFREERHRVVEIGASHESLAGLRAAEAETLAAMRSGVDVIYQAAFFDETWRGRADFLLRTETPSDLGPWSYEVADTKLARSLKAGVLLQLCEYSRQLARLQGRDPELMHVILGDETVQSHRVADHQESCRDARLQLEKTVLSAPAVTYPEPVDHCGRCRWLDECMAQRRADDHLCLVAGMRRTQTRSLVAAGITSAGKLARAPQASVAGIGAASLARLRRQARLQLEERMTELPGYELLAAGAPGQGLEALPPPSRGDLFFDMESDQFVAGGGLEYLFGITDIVAGTPRFQAFWAHTREEEKTAFERVVDFMLGKLDRDPDLHVYHYGAYEPAALRRLSDRHATCEQGLDRLLRCGIFVDLLQVVRHSVCISKESYSLKSIEAFYMQAREEKIADGAASIVAYERYIATRDEALLGAIAGYNERDCESTRLLRDWLEARRGEMTAQAGRALLHSGPAEGAPSAAPIEGIEVGSALVSVA